MLLDKARHLDSTDPLKEFRKRFFVDDPKLIYVDGNSLGRLPLDAIAKVRHALEHEWGSRLIRAWNEGWYDLAERLGNKIGKLTGAAPGQTIIADSTTVNLYKLAWAALQKSDRPTILTHTENFPSDLYVLQGLAASLGKKIVVVPTDEVARSIDQNTALVTLSHVEFKSGRLLDMRGLSKKAKDAGSLTLWDLSHSVGAMPIELDASQVDMAVGCCYKYLNGGPGAPAFLYVAQRLQKELKQPIHGWFGHADPFRFGPVFESAGGIRGFGSGTPPILSLAAIEAGLDLIAEADLHAIREKSCLQTEFFLELTKEFLLNMGFEVSSPRTPLGRGSHVTLDHEYALAIDQSLIHDHNVIPDFRSPNGIRFGLSPLYTSFDEIWLAVDRTRQVMQTESYKPYLGATIDVT